MPSLRSAPLCTPRVAQLAVLAPLALAACASAGTTGSAGPSDMAGSPQPILVDNSTGRVAEMRMYRSNNEAAVDVPGKPDDVYAVLPAAFDRLGLAVNQSVPASKQIGAVEQRVRRRLGKEAVATYVSCGRNAAGMDNADSYEVILTVQSAVNAGAAPTDAKLAVRVYGVARPMGLNGDAVNCETRGVLEQRLAGEVKLLLAQQAPARGD